MNLSDLDWLLITRYLSGESTPAERSRMEHWLAEQPERRTWLQDLEEAGRQAVALPSTVSETFDTNDSWERAATKFGFAQTATPARSATVPLPSRTGRAWRMAGIAAAGAVLVGIAFTIGRSMRLRSSVEAFREFSTPPGNRTNITLRDGTRLVLGPGSRLRVPTDFGTSARTVELDGEAFFAVVHDVAHPFTVRAGAATVTDVGTAYDVRAYAGDAAVRVAVVEGAASVRPARGPSATMLTGGDMATITEGRMVITHQADVAAFTAWTQGHLAFTDTPLRDAVRVLARTYNLDITIADSSLAALPVTESFTDQTVDVILDDITAIVGAQYQRQGRAVTIRRRVRGATHPVPEAHPANTTTTLTSDSRE